jgi:hypothetical protein
MGDVTFVPGTLNIQWVQGARLSLTITAPDDFPDSFTTSGTFLRSAWRTATAGGTAVLTLGTVASGDGFVIVSARVFRLQISAVTLAGIGTPGVTWQGRHDIEIVPGGVAADAYPIAWGNVTLVGESTR